MRREKVNGRTVKTYEKGDGIRRRFRDSLNPVRWDFPRKGLIHHPRSWFVSDAPLRRPVFGVYAMAAFAEDMLWRAKFGKKGKIPSIEDATRLFASTRAALQNTLSAHKIDRRLTPKQLVALRKVVARLVEETKIFIEKLDNRNETQSV